MSFNILNQIQRRIDTVSQEEKKQNKRKRRLQAIESGKVPPRYWLVKKVLSKHPTWEYEHFTISSRFFPPETLDGIAYEVDKLARLHHFRNTNKLYVGGIYIIFRTSWFGDNKRGFKKLMSIGLTTYGQVYGINKYKSSEDPESKAYKGAEPTTFAREYFYPHRNWRGSEPDYYKKSWGYLCDRYPQITIRRVPLRMKVHL